MENEKNENVDIMDGEEIITLYDDEEKPIDFHYTACVEYEGNYYALLEPVEPMDGVEEGDVFIFRLEEHEDGDDMFIPVEDEQLLDAVFEEFMRAEADHECGCGCDECGGECDCEDGDCGCEKGKKSE